MKTKILLFVYGLFLIHGYSEATIREKYFNKNYYIGAVVEYANNFDETKEPKDNILNNTKEYEKLIRNAKRQQADIIVFPEYGLTSTHITNNRTAAISYSSEIPSPNQKTNPCKEKKRINWKNSTSLSTWSEILARLSCEARRNKIYIIVNLPERVKSKNNWILYNTNIVFDRSGTLISRYRKYNLYGEPAFNSTAKPEIVTFQTDFNVTFGVLTCFDILHAEPILQLVYNKKVTDLLFPTAWMSKMPFLTAIQTQAGIVQAYKVNLLASNYDNPKYHGGGSGIYSPISNISNYVPVERKTKLIVSKISKLLPRNSELPVISRKKSRQNYYRASYEMETLTERWDGFTSEILASNVDNHTICNANLCCSFTVESNLNLEESDYFYRLVITDSLRSSGEERHHVQICGIVACVNQTLDSCGKRAENTKISITFENIKITGNFSNGDTFVHFPSIVTYDLNTLPFNFYSYSTNNNLELHINKSVNKILGVSIYSRSKL